MLRVNHVSYALPDRQLLDDVSLEVVPGERVGLIGRNGEGKTTLLRIITGELRADAGTVELSPPDRRLGYLQQGFLERPHAVVSDVLGPPGLAWGALRSLEALGEAMARLFAAGRIKLEAYGKPSQRRERIVLL